MVSVVFYTVFIHRLLENALSIIIHFNRIMSVFCTLLRNFWTQLFNRLRKYNRINWSVKFPASGQRLRVYRITNSKKNNFTG